MQQTNPKRDRVNERRSTKAKKRLKSLVLDKRQLTDCLLGNMENLVAVGVGALFGFALDKAHTDAPKVISGQMEMRDFTMMRMFLAASGTSAAVVLALHLLGIKKRKPETGVALGLGLLNGFGANFVGGILLGAGMYLSGSCPGTVWAQIGAGMPFTSSVLAGGILGTITFGYLEKLWRRNPEFHKRKTTESSDMVPSFMPYAVASILFIGIAAGVIASIDNFFPWENAQNLILANPIEPSVLSSSAPTLEAASWDPLLAGVLIGLLQIPVQLGTGTALGQSSGWVLISSKIAGIFDKNIQVNSPYLYKFAQERKPVYQVLVSGGIIIGAALSQYLGNYPALAPAFAVGAESHLKAFVGGYLLLFGARLGNGCTSGHGLSGMAQLSIGAVVSVMGMFMGGMGLAAAMGNFVELPF